MAPKKEVDPQMVAELLEEIDRKIALYNSVPAQVTDYLQSAGLSPIPLKVEEEEPQLPEDISTLDVEGLNRLYDRFARYYDFVSRKLSEAEGLEHNSKRLKKLLDSVLYFKYLNDPRFSSAQDRNHAIALDWDFVRADVQADHIKNVVNTLTRRLANMAQARDRIYREISRRTRTFDGPAKRGPGGLLNA